MDFASILPVSWARLASCGRGRTKLIVLTESAEHEAAIPG